MVSNAFTSNGYAVLGKTPGGILTSIFLVWSGYILSGVGTATLAGAIVHRNSKKKFEKWFKGTVEEKAPVEPEKKEEAPAEKPKAKKSTKKAQEKPVEAPAEEVKAEEKPAE